MDQDQLTSALELVARGFNVIPLHGVDENGGCTCGALDCSGPGKHPRIRQWISRATTDPAVIEQWWMAWSDSNVGVATGRRSGIVVVDVDPRNGGSGALDEIQHGFDLPATLTARTGGGGLHLYFRYPVGLIVRDLPALKKWKHRGIDVQADRKLVVAVGSRHASGSAYEWEVDTDIAGICNETRNVVGLMPHPERASESVLGSEDGVVLLQSLLAAANNRTVLAS
jgi:putative DNA primase/helicase